MQEDSEANRSALLSLPIGECAQPGAGLRDERVDGESEGGRLAASQVLNGELQAEARSGRRGGSRGSKQVEMKTCRMRSRMQRQLRGCCPSPFLPLSAISQQVLALRQLLREGSSLDRQVCGVQLLLQQLVQIGLRSMM